MSNTNTATPSAPLLTTPHSCWSAARDATRAIVAAHEAQTWFDWIGLDERGEVILGPEATQLSAAVVVVTPERLGQLEAELRALGGGGIGSLEPDGNSTEAIRRMGLLVQVFEEVGGQVGPDGELFEPGASDLLLLWGPPARGRLVHFAAPGTRDRVAAHVSRGCEHCARPAYATPEDPKRWDSIEAWQRRWESTRLSAAEAARWTDMAGCRPDVAMLLRASGARPEDLQRCFREACMEMSEPAEMADGILRWVRSGYSWREIDEMRGWLDAPYELPLVSEIRARGIDGELVYGREVEIDGKTTMIDEWLCEQYQRADAPGAFDEALERLEREGLIPAWGAALREAPP